MFGSKTGSGTIHTGKTRSEVGRPERRHCSILRIEFAQLAEAADSLEPDEVGGLVADLLGRLTDPILTCDGVLLAHLQAGVVAIWNAPHEQSNHARLALAAARAAMSTAAAGGQPSGLRPHGAVVTGDVVVGNFGSRHRRAYAPIGSLVSSAEAACLAAPEGALLISRATLEEATEGNALGGEYAEERF